ncbi:hypothetical protein VSS37_01510 [Candidatus Thiothrix sp. Deng01]|uniref:Uncharacterized protein n=1 Tax=Candidatus Thiothrix phosphatis TaxID=3112415 RepID=A0ABU6CS47_9GAMM|nr:hypothetical protein [Candidatus Thiothrix sp. Deng01]MEB4589646.1 hypothetical protein [Candidatus Thiothrix sp. Deng01]
MFCSKKMTGLATVILLATVVPPAHAHSQNYPLRYSGDITSAPATATENGNDTGSAYLYEQLGKLLGKTLYAHLLKNEQFLNLQELVIAHVEEKYMVSSPSH